LSRGDSVEHLALQYAVTAVGAMILPMDHCWTEVEKEQKAKAFNARLFAPVARLYGPLKR